MKRRTRTSAGHVEDARPRPYRRMSREPLRWLASRKASVPILCSVAVAVLAAWLGEHAGLPWSLAARDEYQYAEMARRLAHGEGFTTGIIYPAELHLGASEDHPAVLRPPMWPLLLAGVFQILGVNEQSVHAALLMCFVACALATSALATSLAGRGAGLLAGLMVALSPQLRWFSMFGLAETAFALFVTLAFAMRASRKGALWTGAAIGCAYLTRYNGLVLLPAFVFIDLLDRKPKRVLLTLMGFAAVAAPWWVRNLLVTGDPFYSLSNLNLYLASDVWRVWGANKSILFMLEPDLHSAVAVDPWTKLWKQLPVVLSGWPLASWNLAACLGVVLGGVRSQRPAWTALLVLLGTTVGICLGVPTGRYFVPFIPVVLAIGLAGWWRQRRWLGMIGVSLMVTAPWLPAPVGEATDVRAADMILDTRRRSETPGHGPAAIDASAPCWQGRPLVMADHVERIVWETDAIGIYTTATREDFWTVLERHPIRFVQSRLKRFRGPRFGQQLVPRPDCGEEVFAARSEEDRATSSHRSDAEVGR